MGHLLTQPEAWESLVPVAVIELYGHEIKRGDNKTCCWGSLPEPSIVYKILACLVVVLVFS